MTRTPTPEELARRKATSRPGGRFEVKNSARGDDGAVDVMIYDEIGIYGITAGDFMRELATVKGRPLNVFINSPGGDVFDGYAILNQLRRHDAPVRVYVDGLAASAASFIAMAGETVTMGRNSQMMIHDASGMCWGNAADMRDVAERLDQVSGNIAAIYAEKTGGAADEWRTAMQAETWYTADEAVAAGLADAVAGDGEDPETTNRFDLSVFAHAGRSKFTLPAADGLSNPASPAVEPATDNQEGGAAVSDAFKTALAQRLGVHAKADELDDDQLLEALDEALSEQTTEAPAVPADKPVTTELPEGTVVVDRAALDALKADAAAGREAKNALDVQRRERIVDQAIQAGKLRPVDRAEWVRKIERNEDAITDVLADMAPVFPVEEKGFTGGVENHSDNDITSELERMAGWAEAAQQNGAN